MRITKLNACLMLRFKIYIIVQYSSPYKIVGYFPVTSNITFTIQRTIGQGTKTSKVFYYEILHVIMNFIILFYFPVGKEYALYVSLLRAMGFTF